MFRNLFSMGVGGGDRTPVLFLSKKRTIYRIIIALTLTFYLNVCYANESLTVNDICFVCLAAGVRKMDIRKQSEKYLDYLTNIENCKEGTIRRERRHVRWFLEFLEANRADVTKQSAIDFFSCIPTESAQVKNRVKVTVKHFIRYLKDQELINFDIEFVKTKSNGSGKNTRGVISEEEYKKMLEICDGLMKTDRRYIRWKAVLQVFWETGLRREEILCIEMDKFNLSEPSFEIQSKKDGPYELVYFQSDISYYINEYKPKKYLFELSGNQVFEIVSKTAKRAGIERKISPHYLRHSFGTGLLMADCPPAIASRFLRQTNLRSIDTYFHLVNKKKYYQMYFGTKKVFDLILRFLGYEMEVKFKKVR